MGKHARVGCPDVCFEAGIEHANLRPVKVEGLYIGIANTSAKTGLFKGQGHGTHGRLRCQTRHA